MNNLTIRRGTPDEAAQVALHRRLMFADIREYPLEALLAMEEAYHAWVAEKMSNDGYVAFFAVNSDDEIIGGAGAWIREWLLSPRNLSGKDAHVIDVYVRPAYRRRGIARDLMQTLVDWCEAQGGIPTATLEASNQGRPLYESLGFEAMNMMRKRF
jgi:GNAT superfamily N-acetyltransferase